MRHNRRVRTVLYNDQKLTLTELELVHTPALQRLYDLKQLGLTDRIFIDASHSRLHHAIGVIQQVENLICALQRNLKKEGDRKLEYSHLNTIVKVTFRDMAAYVCRRKSAVRLMGLLHDLTHAPFGHTLEDEIRLTEEKHDEPARQAEAFYRLLVQYLCWRARDRDSTDWTLPGTEGNESPSARQRLGDYLDAPHRLDPPTDDTSISELIDIGVELLTTEGAASHDAPVQRRFLKDLLFAMRALLHLDVLHKRTPKAKLVPAANYNFERVITGILERVADPMTEADTFIPQRDAFLLDAIGNTICADLLDYAKRDSFFAGMKLDYDAERIVENFTLVSYWNREHTIVDPKGGQTKEVDHPFAGHSLRTAISLFSHKLRIDVPGELLNLLQVRFYVYERMLFHPTKCIAGAMLGAALQLIGWKRLPSYMRHVGDAVFLHEIAEAARVVRDLIADSGKADATYDQGLAEQLLRKLSFPTETGVSMASKKLIRDRLMHYRDVRERLATLRNLTNSTAVDASLARAAGALERLPRMRADEPYDRQLVSALVKDLANESTETRKAVKQLALSFLPTVRSVLIDLHAGLRLLERLGARRYHKTVFRLLPNVHVGPLNDLNAEDVAKLFADASTRMVTEREIERRAGLPRGSIVIHCPVAEGPRKIADILITKGKDETGPVRLREIGKLDRHIFGKHEEAIRALESMYASMWRLVVSVAPPHHANWKDINEQIGPVLFEVLSNGQTGSSVPNDPYMDRELIERGGESSIERDEQVQITWPDGSEEFVTVEEYEFLKGAREEFKRARLFETVFRNGAVERRAAAMSRTAKQSMDNVQSQLTHLRLILDNATDAAPMRLDGPVAADQNQPTFPGMEPDGERPKAE